jgi:pentatricopeptide repeat protein
VDVLLNGIVTLYNPSEPIAQTSVGELSTPRAGLIAIQTFHHEEPNNSCLCPSAGLKTYTALLAAYGRAGQVDAAQQVFQELQVREPPGRGNFKAPSRLGSSMDTSEVESSSHSGALNPLILSQQVVL